MDELDAPSDTNAETETVTSTYSRGVVRDAILLAVTCVVMFAGLATIPVVVMLQRDWRSAICCGACLLEFRSGPPGWKMEVFGALICVGIAVGLRQLSEPPVIASLLLLATLFVLRGLGTRLSQRMDREAARWDRKPGDERSPS